MAKNETQTIKLEDRIAQKRKEAAAAKVAGGQPPPESTLQPPPPTQAVVGSVDDSAVFPSETPTTPPLAPRRKFPTETPSLAFFAPQIAELKTALESETNPYPTAEMLAAILAAGLKRKLLLPEIGKSASWLSKRLGLLDAPIEIRRLIEAGELSESEYYDNRGNIKAGIVGRGGSARYNRVPTISITIDAAKSLASILKYIAEQNGAAPIRLDATAGKKDLTNILNLRAGEIKGLLK